MSQDTPVPEPDPVPVPEHVPETLPAQAAEPVAELAVGSVAEPEPAPELASGPVAESAAEPGAEASAAPFPELFPEPPANKPRRRGRTTLLIAAAAVLGVLAGGGLGYRIQQERPPTPLPPLTGPVLAQPKGAGPAAPKLTAEQDSGLVYRGDLLKLLLATPKGDKESYRDWVSLAEYAEEYTRADAEFRNLTSNAFQRSVEADWTDKSHAYYEVHLTQFRDEGYANAPAFFEDQKDIDDSLPEDGRPHGLTDVGSGTVYGSGRPESHAGYLPIYRGRGIARIGNIYVEVYVDSLHPVKSGTVRSLLEKQLERL